MTLPRPDQVKRWLDEIDRFDREWFMSEYKHAYDWVWGPENAGEGGSNVKISQVDPTGATAGDPYPDKRGKLLRRNARRRELESIARVVRNVKQDLDGLPDRMRHLAGGFAIQPTHVSRRGTAPGFNQEQMNESRRKQRERYEEGEGPPPLPTDTRQR